MDLVTVMNRSAGKIVYKIPDRGIRRELMPGQTIRVSKEEIEALNYAPGGHKIIADFLYVKDDPTLDALNVHREPEYYMTGAQVKKLLEEDSLDQFLDALDFAPDGVLDMIKDLAVELPLNDVAKREALKNHKRTNFDVSAAIASRVQDKAEEEASEPEVKPQRRVTNKTTPTRRVATRTTAH